MENETKNRNVQIKVEERNRREYTSDVKEEWKQKYLRVFIES